MNEIPDTITKEEMRRIFAGGPAVGPNCVFAMVGDRIYKQERDCWRLLDNKTYRNTQERTHGS